ncbi:MAG: M23 family metallopeptidase [Candidatus Cloacimonadales bacterium]
MKIAKHFKIKIIVVLLIILSISLVIVACSKQQLEQPEEQYQTHNFTLAKGGDLIAQLEQKGYRQSADFSVILGENFLSKAPRDSVKFWLRTSPDTLQIESAVVSSYNATYTITTSATDSLRYSIHVEKPILRGGSIFQVLTDVGMPAKSVGYFAWKLGEYIEATSIDVGDLMTVDYHVDSLNVKHFEKFSYHPDKTSIHEFYIHGPRELKYNMITLPYELQRRVVTGELSEEYWTLDAALNDLGVIPYIRQQVNNAMQSQVAFSTDARVGDEFEVYIEEKYVDGELQPRGKVLYAKYSGRRAGTKYAYRFDDKADASAFTGMYTKAGKRLVTDAVRTPLDRMHVSSAFGYRIHPISGKRKLHTGIDLRGWTGTPVYAVTSGTVIKAKNSGDGYGNDVRIRHDNGMISQYAHLHAIKTRYGRRVRKGQLIGTVGSTGYSTGPHLHFGVQQNGRWVNPSTNLRMVGANQLAGSRLQQFKTQISNYDQEMKQIAVSDSVITVTQEYLLETI